MSIESSTTVHLVSNYKTQAKLIPLKQESQIFTSVPEKHCHRNETQSSFDSVLNLYGSYPLWLENSKGAKCTLFFLAKQKQAGRNDEFVPSPNNFENFLEVVLILGEKAAPSQSHFQRF